MGWLFITWGALTLIGLVLSEGVTAGVRTRRRRVGAVQLHSDLLDAGRSNARFSHRWRTESRLRKLDSMHRGQGRHS